LSPPYRHLRANSVLPPHLSSGCALFLYAFPLTRGCTLFLYAFRLSGDCLVGSGLSLSAAGAVLSPPQATNMRDNNRVSNKRFKFILFPFLFGIVILSNRFKQYIYFSFF
jgi:hypothetical protein